MSLSIYAEEAYAIISQSPGIGPTAISRRLGIKREQFNNSVLLSMEKHGYLLWEDRGGLYPFSNLRQNFTKKGLRKKSDVLCYNTSV